MQHQKAIVKKKVPEGEVLAETAGSPQKGQHPRPLRHGSRRATIPLLSLCGICSPLCHLR